MMMRSKLTKMIASTLVAASILALNPIGAMAEWKEDSLGTQYLEGTSYVTGWKQIDGKWYYFYSDGHMVKDIYVDGWYLDSNGVGTECVHFQEFEIDKSTGTLAKLKRKDAFVGPRVMGISLDIPKIIDGIEIKHIGGKAFDSCNNLSKITIPDGITGIGDFAFDDCRKLTSINIPNSVASIGKSAFGGCINLTNMKIPEGVTSIDDWTFRGCEKLTSVTIPNSVTHIGQAAFENCTSLTSITIPDNVTNLDNVAFYGCKNTTFYVGNEDVKNILNAGSHIDANKIIVKS